MQILEHDEEGWYYEEQGYGTYAHTANHTKCEGTVAVGTSTTLYHQWYHTDNHRGNSHEDRTQTLLTSLEGSILDAQALCTAL